MAAKINWDALGIVTSVGCAIHCAVLPLLIGSLPFFGVNIIHNSLFEWGMIFIAFGIGCISLLHGYFRHHNNVLPVLIFTTGFLFLILKQFYPVSETLFLTFAVALIISGHIVNYRLCHKH